MSCAAVILAAGASRRLGIPKQMVEVGGETLLARAVRVAGEAGLQPCFVVIATGQEAAFGADTLEWCTFLLNRDAEEGMASSIRLGVEAARKANADGVVMMACDQPAVTAEHLRLLVKGEEEVIASAYAGRRGVPAYFPAAYFASLLELRGDMGARELLKTAKSVELSGGELDVDTVEELEQARRLFR